MNEGVWPTVLGRFAWRDLPFVRAFENPTISEIVGAGAGAIVVTGAVGVVVLITALGKWRYLWSEWFTSLDHKKIGIMYVLIAFVMLTRALIEAILMRGQQAAAINAPGFLSPDHFGQLFSTHGSIMIFFMAMPFLTGLINFVVPLQIGSRDVAFPLLNSIGLWLTGSAAALMMISLVVGKFSTGGWSGYPPYTELSFSPDVGPDYWVWAVTLGSISSTLTGINFAVTIFKRRCPGMRLMRMPMFVWTSLCTSILMIFAMPALTVATALLALDRYLGFHFFTNDLGGNMMNYANLFWLFGHPEVYILILPAFGVYFEVVSTFSSKELYGYTSLVIATMAIAALSFTVWVHHFFTMGQNANINAAFGIATMTIGVPTGVKIYDWIWTMFMGAVRFTVPMLFSLAFMMTFVLGGFTGILLAFPPLDYLVHNTLFLVAHFHNMLIPGLLYGMLAGYHYWFPKAFGFRLSEAWGRLSFVGWVIGFYLAFMPLYVLGAAGMTRRTQAVFEPIFRPWLYIAGIGALFLFGALICLFIQLYVSIRDREANRVTAGDPWDGRSLEWAIAAPPPRYNFAIIPTVTGRDTFFESKRLASAYQPLTDYQKIDLPKSSMMGPLIGLAGGGAAFGVSAIGPIAPRVNGGCLFKLRARRLHDLRPLVAFGRDVSREGLGIAAHDRRAEVGERLARGAAGERLGRGGVEFGDDRRRGRGGRDDTGPIRRLETGHALFGDGRHIGQLRKPRRAANAQSDQRAGLHMRAQHLNVEEQHLDSTRQKIIQRRRRAGIGHVRHVEAGGGAKQLRRKMRHGTGARRAEVEPVALGLRQIDEFRHGLHAEAGGRDHHFRRLHREDHGLQIARPDVRHFLQRRRDGERPGAGQRDRVAIGRGLCDHVGAIDAAGAAAIVDDDRLAQRLRHGLRENARDDVGRAARGERHDEADGTFGPALREGGGGAEVRREYRKSGGETPFPRSRGEGARAASECDGQMKSPHAKAPYSILMLAARMTSPHFLSSD
jgi:cytochrome o ubiquinol oxidase subunit 1